jgi:hypothetical protein
MYAMYESADKVRTVGLTNGKLFDVRPGTFQELDREAYTFEYRPRRGGFCEYERATVRIDQVASITEAVGE